MSSLLRPVGAAATLYVVLAALPSPVLAADLPPGPAPAPAPDDVAALRAEVKALRGELESAVGPADAVARAAERSRLETELANERQKLAALQAAVDAGLDRASIAEAIAKTEARIAELAGALAKLPERRLRSLSEVSSAVDRLDAQLSEPKSPTASKNPAATEPALKPGSPEPAKLDVLPLEFTAFGDFNYRFVKPGADDFAIGAVELDVALNLVPYVGVSTALAYSGADDAFGLGAFVIDCGLAGDGEAFVIQSKAVSKSGVAFGKFDVPFGVAYLEYASVDNRLVTTPLAVTATHEAWSDLGVQAYAIAKHFTALAYLVNGPELPVDAETTRPAQNAVGGRLSAKLDGWFELGGSAAGDFAGRRAPLVFAGGDLSGTLGPLDLRGEYLLRHADAPGVVENTHGIYGRGVLDFHPAYLVGRYDTVLEGSEVLDRRLSAGGAFQVFAEGEVRALYEHSFDSDARSVVLQLVGGSTFQPTGLRR